MGDDFLFEFWLRVSFMGFPGINGEIPEWRVISLAK